MARGRPVHGSHFHFSAVEAGMVASLEVQDVLAVPAYITNVTEERFRVRGSMVHAFILKHLRISKRGLSKALALTLASTCHVRNKQAGLARFSTPEQVRQDAKCATFNAASVFSWLCRAAVLIMQGAVMKSTSGVDASKVEIQGGGCAVAYLSHRGKPCIVLLDHALLNHVHAQFPLP